MAAAAWRINSGVMAAKKIAIDNGVKTGVSAMAKIAQCQRRRIEPSAKEALFES